MKVAKLAKEIGLQPKDLFQQLVHRGVEVKSVEHPLDALNVAGILDAAKSGGTIDFDSLFGPLKNDVAENDQIETVNYYSRRKEDVSDSEAFEKNVGNRIGRYFPCSHLSGVFLFVAEQLSNEEKKHGREIDHLLHIKKGEFHRLLIIEAKNQPILTQSLKVKDSDPAKQDWIVQYTNKSSSEVKIKNVKNQLWHQARAILQMIKPIPEMDLEIQAIAVSSSEETKTLTDDQKKDDDRVIYRLMSWGAFTNFLEDLSSEGCVLRISQSELLRRLRQGMPSPQLGHPDIRDAVDYHKRLRLTLDFGLFQLFDPTSGKWAINGTAGMGKSVLLAYAACVMCSDYIVKTDKVGQLRLQKFDSGKKKIPALEDRRVVLYSLKEKQRKIVDYYWRLLIDTFQRLDEKNELRIQRPEILLWKQGQNIEGNVVLIDEAHDLSQKAQERIANWLEPENNEDVNTYDKYLIIACDRHQKLRLIEDGEQARMISGLDFSRCTRKLKRVYRNPFSVYVSGLGLMFRWFAPSGVKVVPSENQLEGSFGFEVKRRDLTANTGCELAMTEDAHPANNWHHCVSDFPDATTAHGWLMQYNFTNQDVLWVRFSKEDPFFDYENLQSFQYHNLCTEESASIIDKYIKGQEFPVVVIEGVSKDFNNFDDLEKMFFHRRELYLCSSRATVFLFFIIKSSEDDSNSSLVLTEFETLLKQTSIPKKITASTQFWGLEFDIPDGDFAFKQFQDLMDPIEENSEVVERSVEHVEQSDQIPGNKVNRDKTTKGSDSENSQSGNLAKEKEKSNDPTLKTNSDAESVEMIELVDSFLPPKVISRVDYCLKYTKKKKGLKGEYSMYFAESHLMGALLFSKFQQKEDTSSKSKINRYWNAFFPEFLSFPDTDLIYKYGRLHDQGEDYGVFLRGIENLNIESGFSVLDSYTIGNLSTYLDEIPHKLIRHIMDTEKKIFQPNERIRDKLLIERVCNSYDSPAPWLHPIQGMKSENVFYNGVLFKFGIFKTIGPKLFEKEISREGFNAKLAKHPLAKDFLNMPLKPLSGSLVFLFLKDIGLDPAAMLRLLEKTSYNTKDLQKIKRSVVERLKKEVRIAVKASYDQFNSSLSN